MKTEELSHIPFLQNLSTVTLHALAQVLQPVSYPIGSVLFEQDDPVSSWFILEQGRVKLYRQSRDRVQILALLLHGDSFGAETLPTHQPCPCTATALTPTEVFATSATDLERLISNHLDFQHLFLGQISVRLREFVTLVHDLAFRDVTSRLAAVLVQRALHEGTAIQDGLRIERLLTQQEYADMVGTAREVISRTFKKFQADGLLRLDSTFIDILDLDHLTAIAHQEAR